jgi:hypothetical protein
VHETWGRWRAEHPETLVLSIRRDAAGRRFTDPYAYSSSGEQDSNVPYSWYVTKVPVYHPRTFAGLTTPRASTVSSWECGRRRTRSPISTARQWLRTSSRARRSS